MMNTDPRQPTREFLECIDIHELLPQQEPFVMVGRMTHFDMTEIITETVIMSNNLFVDGHFFSASGLIENIAQTCAARIGYVNKHILKKGIQIGFIGAIKNLSIHRLPSIGETIVTTVDVVEEVFGMSLAKAVITCADEVIVTAEMKIALKEGGKD